jgi:hypothetical protein
VNALVKETRTHECMPEHEAFRRRDAARRLALFHDQTMRLRSGSSDHPFLREIARQTSMSANGVVNSPVMGSRAGAFVEFERRASVTEPA